MNITYLGSGRFGLPCLNALACSKHKINLVITQPAQPAGRGRRPTRTPVARWAAENSVAVVETGDVNSPEIIDRISRARPDLIVVIAFGQKISKQLVEVAPKGAINVHASLLPRYRGAAPVNWAIINGETETGLSIITVAERMDAGDILAQVRAEMGRDETAEELGGRLAEMAAPLLIDTVDKIAAGTAVYQKQDESKVTRAPKLKKSDGFIDWELPAESLHRRILGLWSWPGAVALYKSKRTGRAERVVFARAGVLRMANPEKLPPGTIDENLNVVCGRDRLQIMQLKPENSRLMSFADFVNGRRVCPGDCFAGIEE